MQKQKRVQLKQGRSGGTRKYFTFASKVKKKGFLEGRVCGDVVGLIKSHKV